MTAAPLASKVKKLPFGPGCYLFKDSEENILYAGKSKCLYKRVSSYFGKQQDEKIAMMMKFAADVDHISTDTDIEALLLEYKLIKTYRPPYNSKMRKDKERWYITADKRGLLPGLYINRDAANGKNLTNTGPFSRREHAEAALTAIGDYWKLPTCGFVGAGGGTPCLRHHINRCMGPCSGTANAIDYQAAAEEALKFLKGDTFAAFEAVTGQMREAAEALDFKKAARLRDCYESLKSTAGYLSYVPPDLENKKYLVLLKSRHEECFLLIHMHNGALKCWLRLASPDEWGVKSEMLKNYITTGEAPKSLPRGDFRVFEENHFYTEAVLEVDALRCFLETV